MAVTRGGGEILKRALAQARATVEDAQPDGLPLRPLVGHVLAEIDRVLRHLGVAGTPLGPPCQDPEDDLAGRRAELLRLRSRLKANRELDVVAVERLAAIGLELTDRLTAAEQSIRARDDLLATVCHDLKGMLTSILMGTSLLLSTLPADGTGSRVREHLELIKRTGERMNHLIRDLVEAARISAGRLAVEPLPQDVTEVLDETLLVLQPLAVQKAVRIEKRVALPLPAVRCDAERIFQVISNLVGNAIKFSSAGSVVSVEVTQEDGEVRFAIGDAGPGIAPQLVPHLFERYWQLHPRAASGSGLGLYIAKGIVEAHAGRIWVVSRLGVGSTFFFTLPL